MNFKYNRNIIDIEASSLGVKSFPIEIALINHSGETYNTLIRPEKKWTDWSTKSEKIHGISRQKLFDEGQSVKRVCEAVNDLANQEHYFSDYWVCDNRWLTSIFNAANKHSNLHCLPYEYFMPDEQLQHWQQLKDDSARSLNIQPHRALNDVQIIQHALDTLAASGKIEQPQIIAETAVTSNWHHYVSDDYKGTATHQRSQSMRPITNQSGE